jgi:uncharacterized protein with ParB-like and HNH nuclease domain
MYLWGKGRKEEMKYSDINQFPTAHYQINVRWSYLEKWLESFSEDCTLNLNPVYQREHVWNEQQKIAYVEYILRGGEVSKTLYWNNAGCKKLWDAPMELVDGKQRLEAVRSWLRGDILAFGLHKNEFEGVLMADFVMKVCNLKTSKDVLELYLAINSGGTPHSQEELNRVRSILKKEEEEEG